MSFYKRSSLSFLGHTDTETMPFKDDLGGIGSAEEEANGLTLCTEYLGFESYDMRMSEKEVENKMMCHEEEETEKVERKRRKTEEEENAAAATARERKKMFPPPLSSLNGRGQRSFYLRPVRKEGRLKLTQVIIDRHEIFHASREDGRLRLHLVDASCEEIDEEEEDATSDQVVDLSMNNDYKSSHEVLLNNDNDDDVAHLDVAHLDDAHLDDAHEAKEWRYKSCYKIVASMIHDENDHHHHYPYHHYNGNHNMCLWSRSYVKTR